MLNAYMQDIPDLVWPSGTMIGRLLSFAVGVWDKG